MVMASQTTFVSGFYIIDTFIGYAGATRVAISQHFARGSGNVAEVQAKEGAQVRLQLVVNIYE
jgi:hypothetical protein